MKQKLLQVASANFESARYLENYPDKHKCRQHHGHSFITRVRTEHKHDSPPFYANDTQNLEQALRQCVSSLDYSLLNNHLDDPSDENLAHWIRQQIQLTDPDLVGIQSTRHQGTDIDLRGKAHLWRRYRFEAAHQLPNVPAGHQCGRMHGHGFEVILHADRSNREREAGIDYETLDQHWAPLQRQLDRACLNNITGLENPTSEALCDWIWQRIKSNLPCLSWVTVYETVTAGCHFDGMHYRIWKEQRFESALFSERPDGNDENPTLLGHSYLIRLHLTAPLDPVMCWTIDYGDVKEIFKPVYNALDHHLLNDLPGLENTDSGSVSKWIRQQLEPALPQLDRIDLYHKPECGVILNWGEHEPALPS
jgi:6-pyruvoyltetrahydropterin/6-carboxytetrahydropterin synthase